MTSGAPMQAATPMSEADLCAAFIAAATQPQRDTPQWIAYPETAGFDILLVRTTDGVQVGVEAKLTLNPRVVAQILPPRTTWYEAHEGPDYRAVLVPAGKCNSDVRAICDALGVTVIEHRGGPGEGYYEGWARGPIFSPALPVESYWRHDMQLWHEWLPLSRCPLPDYVPDVAAGSSAPVSLTAWKVKAIKLLILAAERPVTRADFKHLQLSPTSWLCPNGWLDRVEHGWVAGPRTPDLRRQHPVNFAQIEADKPKWAPVLAPARQEEGSRSDGLTLRALHAANIARQAEWCPDQVPDLSFRGNELAGEVGEACNVVKKLERERHGWRGSRATLDDLAQELADVVICADLCAITAGINLDAAVVAKFNATSEKQGLRTMLPAPTPDANSGGEAPGGWRPIDTAPRDGTWIETCRIGEPDPSFCGLLYHGYAEPPETAWWCIHGDRWQPAQRPHDFWLPTHWRSLSAAPHPSQEKGEADA